VLEENKKRKVFNLNDNSTKEDSPIYLTLQEVSDLLHVHASTLRRWSNMGILPVSRIGQRGDRRFKQEDINTFLTKFDRRK
jgi:excisionase family DNA binding protein